MDSFAVRKLLISPIYLIPLIIFVEGFVSIGIEMLTIRQLLPVAGGSVVVTSLVIGVFLLFLALGYHRGGRIIAYGIHKLRVNFILAATLLGMGLSYFFISIFFYYVEKCLGSHIVYPLSIFLLFVLAPMVYLLGQTIPITLNLIKHNQAIGQVGGDTLGLSTLGSFLGAVLTTLLLMQYFGVAWTIFINCCLLIVLTLLLVENYFSLLIFGFVGAGILVSAFGLNVIFEKHFFNLTDNYSNYQIMDSAQVPQFSQPGKILFINEAANSFLDKNKKGFPYVELIKKILFSDLKLHDANILVIGAGGFSLSAENTFHNRFTYVDIDGRIKKVIVPTFLDQINGNLIIDDGRHYLSANEQKYDVIITDAYTNIKYIPAHLITREFMLSIKKRLTERGVAILNIIAKPTFSDTYSKRIDNTIRAVFANCVAYPINYSEMPTNIIYVCANRESGEDRKIYSDNLNTSTTDSFDW